MPRYFLLGQSVFLGGLALAAVSCGGGALQRPGDGPHIHVVWSGEVQISAPGFAWGPFDRLTLGFAADGTLNASQFAAGIDPPHTYGAGPNDFPLEDSRDVPLTTGSSFEVHVTVQTAEFASDRFDLAYHVAGTGDTPDTDYVEETAGQLDGTTMHVTYSMTGTYLGPPIAATGSGDLRPD
jgi:hypothetical protein